MIVSFGWVVVLSSRARYVDLPPESLDLIDAELDATDERVWSHLRTWLSDEMADPWLNWQLVDQLNNERGVLQFSNSRNHRGGMGTWALMKWIADNATGSYGLVYVHDDEDDGFRRRTGVDRTNEFRAFRCVGGQWSEHDDPFLSPVVPVVRPTFEA